MTPEMQEDVYVPLYNIEHEYEGELTISDQIAIAQVRAIMEIAIELSILNSQKSSEDEH